MSSLSHYLNQSRGRVRQNRVTRDALHLPRSPEKVETFLDQARDQEAAARAGSVWLVAKRPPISHLPFFWRRLARIVYEKFHWCPDYGIEYQGVFTDEAEARYEASQSGGFYMELPLNGALPDVPCQYGKHDFPLSEVSAEYRNRKPAFVAVRRETAEGVLALEQQLDQLEQHMQDQCVA